MRVKGLNPDREVNLSGKCPIFKSEISDMWQKAKLVSSF